MRILVCLSRFPYPLNKGDKLRAFCQIKELSKHNDIYLFCLTSRKINESETAILKKYCKNVHIENQSIFSRILSLIKSLFFSLPLQTAFFTTNKSIKNFITYFNGIKPDVSYFQFVRTGEYAKNISGKKVLDFQDCLSENMKRRAMVSNFVMKKILLFESKRLANYEDKMFGIFSSLTIITEADKEKIPSKRNNEIHVIENGVSDKYFNYDSSKEKQFDIIFSGNMSYAPNVNACKYLTECIMPEVRNKIPNAKLVIAGSNPKKSVIKCADNNTIVTGWVEDMREYYSKSRVFIAPMQIGTGLQNKLLEAMAMKLPCVTTPLANDALNAENFSQILVGNSAEELANHIINLLTDKTLYSNIALNGYNFVKDNYNWEKSCNKLEKILKN